MITNNPDDLQLYRINNFIIFQNFNYVEFDNFFLIETEEVCFKHYNNLLPIYDIYGKLKNNILFDDKNEKKIDLPLSLIKLFGIEYNFNKKDVQTILDININDIIENLTNNGNILLCIFYYQYFYYLKFYNVDYSKIFPYLSEIFINHINITLNDSDISFEKNSDITEHDNEILLDMYYSINDMIVIINNDPSKYTKRPLLIKYNEPDEQLLSLINT